MANQDIVVNGVQIGPQSDLVNLFRRALKGEAVFPSRTAFGPEDGVTSVVEATRGTPLEPRVRDAILSLLVDSDARVRAGAVMAIETFPRVFDGPVLLQILDEKPGLFRGVPAIARGFTDIYWELLRAIAGTGSQSPIVLERLRSSVTDPTNGHWVVAGLTRADPDWVLDHATNVVAAQPSRVNAVLANLNDPKKREQFITGLRRESDGFRKEAAERLDRVVTDPQQRERLARLLSSQ